MEGQFETEDGAPLRIGGIPDVASRTTRYAIEVPKGLSLLGYHDPDARVLGLAAFPRDEWPDPVPVHLAFQAMVAGGTAMALLSVAAAWLFWKKREGLFGRRFLVAVALCGPVGLLCVEAGWGVTEMGRQPWAIRGIMRTAEAVTPVGGLLLPFAFFSLLYLGLGAASVWLLRREVAASPFFPAGSRAADPHGTEGKE
jgi:cytochrome d ubiquinol oxidase subunit I